MTTTVHPALRADLADTAGEEERAALRASLRRFLDAKAPELTTLGSLEAAASHDPAVWARLTQELGITALAVPEESGGLGCGWAEFRVILEELGRVVYPGPFFVTLIATRALTRLGAAELCADVLEGVAGGRSLTLVGSAGRHLGDSPIRGYARADGEGGWTVTGSGRAVCAAAADGFLVLAQAPDGTALFRIEAGAAGLDVTALPTMDLTRRLSDLSFESAPAVRLSRDPIAAEAVSEVLAEAALALAAEQVGGARRAMETTVTYVRERFQFGRPVGSFQAVKHRLADTLVLIESADAACADALAAVDGERPDRMRAIHLAAAICADAYLATARAMVQLHGGIGFTWEHPAHLHLKRARSSSLLYGSTRHHRRALALELGLQP